MFYSALAIANFIIDRCTRKRDPVSNLRLQKLLYFVWVDYYREKRQPLFYDKMHAWKFGPVVPEVYYEYCVYGGRPINLLFESELTSEDEELVEDIVEKYRLVSVNDLVARTHRKDTAWYQIYDEGRGNRQGIPYDLIKKKEFGEDYVS